jgi:hypothetical protein
VSSLFQATQLLQARKNEEDVAGICEMCDKLRVCQIIKESFAAHHIRLREQRRRG